MEKTERLFLGLHLHPLFSVEINRTAQFLKNIHPDQKWVHLKYVHFTIHFLGDTTSAQKNKIMEVVSKVSTKTQPFEIALQGMGAFPSLKNPRVVWVGAAEECQKHLAELYKRITEPLIQESFSVEHEKFTPHATLFRVKRENPIKWDENIFQFPQTRFKTIDRFFLFKSVLTATGSEYHPCEEFIFGLS